MSKDCKKGNHPLCSGQWEGLGFTVTCVCKCGHSKKHDIYWSGLQWYCRDCIKHGDKPYMTKETTCKGENKSKGPLLNSLLNYATE
jgi:hypothetical protein